MSVKVKDADSTVKYLKSTTDGSDEVVHHNIDNVTGTVKVSDGGNSITVDGTVNVIQSTRSSLNANSTIQVAGSDVSSGNPVPSTLVNGAPHRTDTILNGSTSLTPKYASISFSTSGDNTIVAAVASKKIRVLSLFMVANTNVTVTFQSDNGVGSTDITGAIGLINVHGFVLPYNPVGWFESLSGELLNLSLSSSVQVSGSLVYVEV